MTGAKKNAEKNPAVNGAEHARRRRDLMRMMGEGGIAILPAAIHRLRSRDVEYPFRQDSDFQYLTGFPEPESVAVLMPGRKQGEYVLFCRERDPAKEIWHGPRAGTEGAVGDHGADDAFPIDDLDDILPGLIEGRERVYYTMGLQPEFDQRLVGWINGLRAKGRNGVTTPLEIVALEHLLHDMRLYKSRAEIAVMRRAAGISGFAHCRAMAACRPGLRERDLEAEIVHEFMRRGAHAPAYPSIVGGGANGCILHYIANDAVLNDGDLVLIDAGCELDCYASDVTRTFPVNGRFTPVQRSLYELVLDAQLAAIEAIRPGVDWNAPHEAAVRVLARGLVRLGILKGRVATLIRSQAYRRFFMHRTGHWLGMDVHDVGDYKIGEQWRTLEPGMVLTVEPGLYIAPGAKGVARRWQGIGIRIEDDVVVTRTGAEVLSTGAPKTVMEIESLMQA